MKLPFFNRLPLKKIVAAPGSAGARQAEKMLADLLAELPETLLAYVSDRPGGTLLASYSTSAAYNPHQLTLRNARLLQTVDEAHAAGAWPGGPCTDLTVVLDREVHYLRPLPARGWYCFVAMGASAANMAMVKEVMRRCTSTTVK